jgi:hypothetical protein
MKSRPVSLLILYACLLSAVIWYLIGPPIGRADYGELMGTSADCGGGVSVTCAPGLVCKCTDNVGCAGYDQHGNFVRDYPCPSD